MALAFDAASSGTVAYPGNASSLTFSHTCTGSNLALVVAAGWFSTQGARTVSSVTYNGVALSAIASSSITSTGQGKKLQLWGLAGPATGAHNVVITLSGTDDLIFGGSASFTGADQTTTFGTANTKQLATTNTTPDLGLTSAAGEITVGACLFVANSAAAFSSGDTELAEIFDSTTNGFSWARAAGAASVTMTWSGDTGAQNTNWITSGVPVKPATGGSTFSDSVSETGSSSDTQTALLVASGTVSESGTASDTTDATAIFVATVSESGTATDTTNGTTGNTFSVDVAEAGAALDTVSSLAVFTGDVQESGNAVDTTDSTGGSLVQTQRINVGGGFSWKDYIEEKNRELHLRKLLEKARKEQKALVKKSRKLEQKISDLRVEQKPIEGVLANYELLSRQIEEKKLEVKVLKFELNVAISDVNFEASNDDDEDLLLLL